MVKGLTIVVVVITSVGLAFTVGYAVSQNLDVHRYDVSLSVPYPIKIAHLSDLHYPYSAFSLDEILGLVERLTPDVTVLTGDVADGSAKTGDVVELQRFFAKLSALSKTFLVIGNHEIGSEYLSSYVQIAQNNGVTVLNNEIATVKIKSVEFAIIGLSDGYLYEEKTFSSADLAKTVGKRKILLSHRPEKFSSYLSAPESLKPDLIFCGHAHGGGVRMGKLALYAPNQGFFPKYTSGIYEKDGVFMSVSRGLGRKGEFRLFNSYHLPVVTIK